MPWKSMDKPGLSNPVLRYGQRNLHPQVLEPEFGLGPLQQHSKDGPQRDDPSALVGEVTTKWRISWLSIRAATSTMGRSAGTVTGSGVTTSATARAGSKPLPRERVMSCSEMIPRPREQAERTHVPFLHELGSPTQRLVAPYPHGLSDH